MVCAYYELRIQKVDLKLSAEAEDSEHLPSSSALLPYSFQQSFVGIGDNAFLALVIALG